MLATIGRYRVLGVLERADSPGPITRPTRNCGGTWPSRCRTGDERRIPKRWKRTGPRPAWLASLDHPAIVPVYDIAGRATDIVMWCRS